MALLNEHRKQMIEHHGLTNHPLYEKWRAIKNRCYNPNASNYFRYGGRGIKMHIDWKEHPQAFIEWSIDNGWQEGLSIDRIDNDADYSPNNCRFVIKRIQQGNRRRPKTKRKQSILPIGVYQKGNRFCARYWLNNKCIWVGSFPSAEEASKAYQNAIAA